jgi:hypothetical protein
MACPKHKPSKETYKLNFSHDIIDYRTMVMLPTLEENCVFSTGFCD